MCFLVCLVLIAFVSMCTFLRISYTCSSCVLVLIGYACDIVRQDGKLHTINRTVHIFCEQDKKEDDSGVNLLDEIVEYVTSQGGCSAILLTKTGLHSLIPTGQPSLIHGDDSITSIASGLWDDASPVCNTDVVQATNQVFIRSFVRSYKGKSLRGFYV